MSTERGDQLDKEASYLNKHWILAFQAQIDAALTVLWPSGKRRLLPNATSAPPSGGIERPAAVRVIPAERLREQPQGDVRARVAEHYGAQHAALPAHVHSSAQRPQSRVRDLASVCTDAKLELGMQTVLRETEFGASTVAVYAFDTMNTVQIFLAACGAILGCGSEWPKYTQLDSFGKVVDAPSDSIRYGVSGCRYRSDDGQDEVVVESRGLSYFKIMDQCSVLLWDYADDDDLYPMSKNTLVKRDIIGTYVYPWIALVWHLSSP
ncbi:hypothetical protein GQ600_23663 [Phytophthora cactorum]|nr:hypothetical protein GQ600_23663 [Phytophthora cactorum]